MGMSKKDFKVIAASLNSTGRKCNSIPLDKAGNKPRKQQTLKLLAQSIEDNLAANCPTFNRKKFRDAMPEIWEVID